MTRIMNFLEKNYKKLLIIPILMLLISISILGFWKVNTGEFISKDITLKGGYLITIQTSEKIDIEKTELALAKDLDTKPVIKEIQSLGGGTVGYSFEIEKIKELNEILPAISKATNIGLTDNYTTEESSSALGESFFTSTIKAVIIAFLFMALVVFIYFKKVIPSTIIILAAASDIITTLAIMNITGIKLSTGAVASLLLLIGYSVDSDILLSTKCLKRVERSLNERIRSAIKTGLTMEITTIVAITTLYFMTSATILKQIALIIIIGLLVDMINTWILNAGVLKLYLEGQSGKN
jgi:preprotein translocase subunit SecF